MKITGSEADKGSYVVVADMLKRIEKRLLKICDECKGYGMESYGQFWYGRLEEEASKETYHGPCRKCKGGGEVCLCCYCGPSECECGEG